MNYITLLIKNNSLKSKNQQLEECIKDELFKKFRREVGLELENERLRKENRLLRAKVKNLKEGGFYEGSTTYKQKKRKKRQVTNKKEKQNGKHKFKD